MAYNWTDPGNWQQGVTITSPDDHGGTITQNANPYQWASSGAANQVASQFGGRAFGANIDMPGGSYSSPQNMVGFDNGRQINAGLAGDVLGKYGSGPGSYGTYLVDRDINPDYANAPTYDQWASTKPGYTPGSRAPGGEQVDPAFAAYASGQTASYNRDGQSGQPGQPGQGQPIPPRPQQFQTQPIGGATGLPGQQQGQQGSYFQQMGPILQLLSMLGLFGGQQRQRPPALAQGAQGFPFYSRFA